MSCEVLEIGQVSSHTEVSTVTSRWNRWRRAQSGSTQKKMQVKTDCKLTARRRKVFPRASTSLLSATNLPFYYFRYTIIFHSVGAHPILYLFSVSISKISELWQKCTYLIFSNRIGCTVSSNGHDDWLISVTKIFSSF